MKPDFWLTFKQAEEPQKVFDTFLRWADAAQNNNVQPFRKKIYGKISAGAASRRRAVSSTVRISGGGATTFALAAFKAGLVGAYPQ
jgi:hypothetical protein